MGRRQLAKGLHTQSVNGSGEVEAAGGDGHPCGLARDRVVWAEDGQRSEEHVLAPDHCIVFRSLLVRESDGARLDEEDALCVCQICKCIGLQIHTHTHISIYISIYRCIYIFIRLRMYTYL